MKCTLNQCQVNESMWSSRREDTPLGHQNACSERQHSYGEGMILHIKNNYSARKGRYGTLFAAQLQNTMDFLQGGFFFSYLCMLPEMHTNTL